MTYKKGNTVISVEQIDGFGKNPGLWIGSENELVKVASFGSKDKADNFCKWLEYFLDYIWQRPEWKKEGDS